MRHVEKHLVRVVAVAVVFGLMTVQAFASRAVQVNADFTVSCTNCQTDKSGTFCTEDGTYYNNPGGPYSMQDFPDATPYVSGSTVESQILTNNTVYTLDTSGSNWTRTVWVHFFSSVSGEPAFPNNVLPACWARDPDQNWPINLSVFSSTVGFPQMVAGPDSSYAGWARMNFNNYSGACYNQVNKFRFQWYSVCITHPTPTSWVITTDGCGAQQNIGTGHLTGQGGKKGQTIDYGDWRVPFQLTLTKP